MAFEGCFESFFDFVVFAFGKVRVDGVVGGAVPGGEFGGAPGGLFEGEVDEVEWRLEFGEVGADGVEVKMDPGEGGLVHDVCRDKEVVGILHLPLHEGGDGVVFEE